MRRMPRLTLGITFRIHQGDYAAARSYSQAALQKIARSWMIRMAEAIYLGQPRLDESEAGRPSAAAAKPWSKHCDWRFRLNVTPSKLMGVQAMGELVSRGGRASRRWHCSAFVYDHPAAHYQTRQLTEALFEEWEVDDDELAAARAAAAELELDAVVAELLAEGDE